MNSYESTSGIRDLKVMGARTQLGSGWASATHKLVALDKETLQPVSVDWWYEDESAPRLMDLFSPIPAQMYACWQILMFIGWVMLLISAILVVQVLR